MVVMVVVAVVVIVVVVVVVVVASTVLGWKSGSRGVSMTQRIEIIDGQYTRRGC